ncbi:DNA-binding domain-containing protein [Galbibacter marinus]|uniref:DNA-binding domain-containing protein n=1 Tax=Galbibacter marinus TaxID=555500 RepID=K2NZF8_9FLAO|nr:helix-turn-helix domain-containing protein [Galbibacter marinus]EKF54178.1 DNA-binding domain-containing protein [Galbibacter marinus]
MKHFVPLISCVLLLTQNTLAQSTDPQQKTFDSVFYYTYMNVAASDPDHALKIADSLYKTSATSTQKIRSLMLISDMYYRKSNRDSTLHYALKADRIATSERITAWRARIYGVLSTQYRKSGLLNNGYKFLDKAQELCEKVDQGELSNQIQGQIYQERGFYAQEENDYEQAIAYFQTSDTILRRLPDSPQKVTFRAQSKERIGANLFKLGVIDSAKYYFNKALELEARASRAETVIKGYIYKGLGEIAIVNREKELAYELLSKALAVAEASKLQELNMGVFLAMTKYYKLVGDIENYTLYNQKYLDIITKRSKRERDFANMVVAKTDKKLKEALFTRNTVTFIMAGLCFLVLLGVGIYFYGRRRKLKNKQNKAHLHQNDQASTKEYMSKETSDCILAELEALEHDDFYLKSNLSLSLLANKLNVNTRYVSYVINRNKGLGFNSYVNEIRVRRSMAELENNPELRTYKIAYLAEKYGFSSHSKYTAAFKAVTGITPSIFITRLQDNKKGTP